MHRYTDRTRLVRERTGYRLSDPPSRICTQLISFCIVKLLYTFDKAQVSLLNQVKEAHAAAGVTLCDTDYQTEVCLNQAFFGIFIAFCLALCKRKFFLCGQQRYGTDLLQIHADRILGSDSLKQIYRI